MLTERYFTKFNNARAFWKVNGDFGELDENLTINGNVITSEIAECTLDCKWEKDEYGVFLRSDSFINLSDKPIEINCLRSRFAFEGGEYEIYTQYNNWQSESMGGWQPLITQVSAACQSVRTAQDATPFMVVWSKQQNRGVVFHLLPNCAWEIKAMHIGLPEKYSKVVVELGIAEYNLKMKVLPGEKIEMPRILCYETTNRLDFDAYKLHNFMHNNYPRTKMPMIYNTWLYKFTSFTSELLKEQADIASEMGLEYFVIDAGWFGKGKLWYSVVGDWTENSTGGFYGKMKEFADYVRSKGMKFGLWLEPERAGDDSDAIHNQPEFYLVEGSENVPEGKNNFLDFNNKEAFDWILKRTIEVIETYGVEYIKFDFNANMFYDVYHTSFLKYHNAIERYLSELRKRFPNIYLSGCAGGGERSELANYIKYDSFWPTDNESPYENMRMFKETILRLPPQCYEKVTCIHSLSKYEDFYKPFSEEVKNPIERIVANADAVWYGIVGVHPSYLKGYQTASPIEFSCDLKLISSEMRKFFKEHIEKVKKNYDFWKKAVVRILADTPTLTIYQYSDMLLTDIVIQIMSGKALQNEITVYPVLNPDKVYIINGNEKLSGKEIMQNGIDAPITNWYEMTELTIAEFR